ncbi:MAG: hypothetical protein HQL53_10585, partial [Magnetococcales bacterium]|nr:hypothetical protein [Magnetococcales bacterium]
MIISHELRTPLNSILGFSDVLASLNLDKDSLDVVALIEKSGQSLLKLINDILELVKMEDRADKTAYRDFQISQLAVELSESFQKSLEEKGLSFEYLPATDLPDSVSGDYPRLRRVLLNLLDNAIKYTESGGVTLSVNLKRTEEKEFYHFTVRDTGIGIAQEKHEDIFQFFTQVEPALTRSHGGLGLGLGICKRYVSVMGGRMWMESEPGKGSAFHIVLKLNTVPKADQHPSRI